MVKVLFFCFYRLGEQWHIAPYTQSIEITQGTHSISLSQVVVAVTDVGHINLRHILDAEIGLVDHSIEVGPLGTSLIGRHQVVDNTSLVCHNRCTWSYVVRTELTPIEIILAHGLTEETINFVHTGFRITRCLPHLICWHLADSIFLQETITAAEHSHGEKQIYDSVYLKHSCIY